MVAKRSICLTVVGILGLACLGVGIGLIYIFDNLIHEQIKESVPLKWGGESFKQWKKPTTPIYFQIYVFDVLNPQDIIQGKQPKVNQKGPYTYQEQRVKKDIEFYKNGTVSYREDQYFIFDRSMSVGPEEEKFTGVNLVVLAIMSILKYEYEVVNLAVNTLFEEFNETLFQELSVKEIMWGYEDNLLKEAKKIADAFNVTLPIDDKFGLFLDKNGTDDGLYLIDSGEKGIEHFGEIQYWNGMSELDYWSTDIANAINGSDGTIYHPWTKTSETKYLFSSDLCRSLGMDYTKKTSARGIPLEQYVAPDIMFGNVSTNPYNAGFCTPPGNCLPAGLLNVSVCRTGAPVVMSMPHFLGCADDVQNYVRGIHPIREDHQSHIDLEPMTGVVMSAAKRLQINTYMEKITGFSSTYNIKQPFYMPVLWLNESAVIDAADADKFKSEVLDMLKILDGVKYGLIALGGFLIILVLGFFIAGRLKAKKSDEYSINRNSDETDPLITNGQASHSAVSIYA